MTHPYEAAGLRPLTSTTHPLQVTFYYDTHATPPELEVPITYNRNGRTVLGTKPTTAEEDANIALAVSRGRMHGLPVFAYVHSGATIRAGWTNPFNCRWDSGRSGWAVMTTAEWREYFNVKRLSRKLKKRIELIVEREVMEYNNYLTGECFGWVMRDTATGENVDSCWGYYGDKQVVLDAKSALTQAESLRPMQMNLNFEGAAQ